MANYEFKLPALGEGLMEGEVVKWHVAVGSTIKEDDVIVEIQNDKAVVEVPSPVTGQIKQIVANEGDVKTIGDVLAVLDVEGAVASSAAEEAPAAAPQAPQAEVAAPAAAAAAPVASTSSVAASTEADRRKVLATPAIRKFAREKQVDLSQISGTGKNGRITREDVLGFDPTSVAAPVAEESTQGTAAQAPVASSSSAAVGYVEEERVAFRGIRKAIAKAMVKSVYTAPHVTLMDEVDVTKLVELREQAKPLMEKKGIKVTYLPYIVKALVAAVREYPVLNAELDEENNEVIYKKYYNIGIAADTDNGLVVPVVKAADRKNIWTIASEIKSLATKARDGKLSSDEMKQGTISITNIGSAGGMFFTPVINFPEVAILGTGRISQKPVVRNGEIQIGQMMALSLSFDHRLIDGATAQNALNYIKQLLEDPQLLVMEV